MRLETISAIDEENLKRATKDFVKVWESTGWYHIQAWVELGQVWVEQWTCKIFVS